MISARNKIKGTIREVKEGAVNGIVKLETPKGHKVSATISMEAIRELGLKAGKEATAVIKATEVMMANDFLKISARNQFRGKITEILPGAVNAIVKLDVDAEFGLSSTICLEAVKELSLKAGEEAVAVIKATSVMISVD